MDKKFSAADIEKQADYLMFIARYYREKKYTADQAKMYCTDVCNVLLKKLGVVKGR